MLSFTLPLLQTLQINGLFLFLLLSLFYLFLNKMTEKKGGAGNLLVVKIMDDKNTR